MLARESCRYARAAHASLNKFKMKLRLLLPGAKKNRTLVINTVLYGFESSVNFEAVGGGQQIIDVFLMVNLDAMELANHCQDVCMYSLFLFFVFFGVGGNAGLSYCN